MKQDKIFLEKNRNVKAINKTNNVNVSLEQKARLLPFDDLSDALNLYQLYNDEKDACTKYRLIFTINALCSNALYNMQSEIVYKENTENCYLIDPEAANGRDFTRSKVSNNIKNTTLYITRRQAIKDTEYSHPSLGNFTYNCGVDIFNNHILRAKGFNPIWGPPDSRYNTISSYQYDSDLNIVREELGTGSSGALYDTHVYRIDNIMTMEEAFSKRVRENNGWFGFENPSLLKLPNGAISTTGQQIIIDRLLNNKKECEFIDLYPDRSLFSFIPKVNKQRKRVEYNWDYCITYPYSSDYEKFNIVMGGGNHGGIIAEIRLSKGVNGEDIYVFKTIIKHNLNNGNAVRIFADSSSDDWSEDVIVQGTGNENGMDAEHCFKIYKNTFNDESKIEEICTSKTCAIKRLAGANECKYYFRKFKKYKVGNKLPNSSINKLAFSENIYGDRMAQIVFTDDIDTAGLKDNLGRPLTELYLTIVKANRGHNEWYQRNYTADTIECSHAFGKVTSGVDLGPNRRDFNIRKLHDVAYSEIDSSYKNGFEELFGRTIPPLRLENDIKLSNFDIFYGDIVEFDPTTNSETTLEKVYHRVNTAQRECTSSDFYDIWYDRLVSDDYEMNVTFGDNQNLGSNSTPNINSDYIGVDYIKIVFPYSGSTQTEQVYATERDTLPPLDDPDEPGGGGHDPYEPYEPVTPSDPGTGGGGTTEPIQPTRPEEYNLNYAPSTPNDSSGETPVFTKARENTVLGVIDPGNIEIIDGTNSLTWYLQEKPDWITIKKRTTLVILGETVTTWTEVLEGNATTNINEGNTTLEITAAPNEAEGSRTGRIKIVINRETFTTTVSQYGTLQVRGNGFLVEAVRLNTTKNGNLFPGNIQLEGYYYAPHTRVPIKVLAETPTTSVGYVLSYPENSISIYEETIGEDETVLRLGITGASQHDYVINDLFGVITTNNEIKWYNLFSKTVDEDEGNILVLQAVDPTNELGLGDVDVIDQIVLCNDETPRYASYNKKEQSFVWREILPYSKLNENTELGDVTFTNGAIYRQQNVTFEMKRQDPFGQYGLLSPVKENSVGSQTATRDANPLRAFKKEGMMVNLSGLIYMAVEAGNSCI